MTIDVYVQNCYMGDSFRALSVESSNTGRILKPGESATVCISDGDPLSIKEIPLAESSGEPVFGFDTAIRLLKRGYHLSRSGWNGKNMCVYMNHGSHDFSKEASAAKVNNVSSHLFQRGAEGTVTRMPNINMTAADGSTVMGWLASQTDILAEDWGLAR